MHMYTEFNTDARANVMSLNSAQSIESIAEFDISVKCFAEAHILWKIEQMQKSRLRQRVHKFEPDLYVLVILLSHFNGCCENTLLSISVHIVVVVFDCEKFIPENVHSSYQYTQAPPPYTTTTYSLLKSGKYVLLHIIGFSFFGYVFVSGSVIYILLFHYVFILNFSSWP